MDQLANRGVRFQNAFAASCWTLPSHVSLFTGFDAQVHGVGFSTERIPRSLPTIASFLLERGYRTAAFTANVFWVTHDRVGRGFMHFDDYFHSAADMVLRTMYGRAVEKYVIQRWGYDDIPAPACQRHQSFVAPVDRPGLGSSFFCIPQLL